MFCKARIFFILHLKRAIMKKSRYVVPAIMHKMDRIMYKLNQNWVHVATIGICQTIVFRASLCRFYVFVWFNSWTYCVTTKNICEHKYWLFDTHNTRQLLVALLKNYLFIDSKRLCTQLHVWKLFLWTCIPFLSLFKKLKVVLNQAAAIPLKFFWQWL